MSTTTNHRDWTRTLTEFNRQNEGRPVRVEIDTAELGAQTPEHDLPFRGAAYDPRDDRVEIMLGSSDHGAAHLTHSIEHPEGVDVLAGESGWGPVLRIAHAGGQTLVLSRFPLPENGSADEPPRWRNVAPVDRVVRSVLGMALLLAVFLDMAGSAGAALAWVGLVLMVSGFAGWCPLYAALGIRTARPRNLRPWRSRSAAAALARHNG